MIKNSCMQKFIKNQLIYVDVMIKIPVFQVFYPVTMDQLNFEITSLGL